MGSGPLSVIRVDPDLLRRWAQELREIADGYRAIADRILRASSSVPGFDGQLSPITRAIGAEGHAIYKARADALEAIAQELARKADDFEAADRENQAGLRRLWERFQSDLAALRSQRPGEDEPPKPWWEAILDWLEEVVSTFPTIMPLPGAGPFIAPVPGADPLGPVFHPAIVKPRSRSDWDWLARKLGIDGRTLRKNVESCKEAAGVPPSGDVEVDDETGDIYYNGEYIGNAYDGC
jgi:uncharacterized protein YukE